MVVKKTVGICSDDIFGFYFDMLVGIIAFITAFTYNVVPGKMGLNYYICTGEDPELFKTLGKKVSTSDIF